MTFMLKAIYKREKSRAIIKRNFLLVNCPSPNALKFEDIGVHLWIVKTKLKPFFHTYWPVKYVAV